MASKYVKKPVVIEAVVWNGNNKEEIEEFITTQEYSFERPEVYREPQEWDLFIHTLEGNHKANIGDYIIKGLAGEFYPCKPDIFHKSYDSYK